MRILRTTAVFILIALVVWLTLFTSAKLYKMAAIRGWMPGAIYKEHVVTDKRALEDEYGPVYWVAWEGGDITQRSNLRENLDEEQWSAIKVGDKVAIAYYRGAPEPYKPDGIFVSLGNFGFDLVLLFGEILLTITLVRLLLRQWENAPSNLSLNREGENAVRRTGQTLRRNMTRISQFFKLQLALLLSALVAAASLSAAAMVVTYVKRPHMGILTENFWIYLPIFGFFSIIAAFGIGIPCFFSRRFFNLLNWLSVMVIGGCWGLAAGLLIFGERGFGAPITVGLLILCFVIGVISAWCAFFALKRYNIPMNSDVTHRLS
jgi:hypothetical protein